MATTTNNRYSRDTPRYVALARRIRNSFLLSFATIGLTFVVIAGPLLAVLGANEASGIFAATGVIIFVVNVVGYGCYKLLERVY
jgi:hypothetical protein